MFVSRKFEQKCLHLSKLSQFIYRCERMKKAPENGALNAVERLIICYAMVVGFTVSNARWPSATFAFGKMIASPCVRTLCSISPSVAST